MKKEEPYESKWAMALKSHMESRKMSIKPLDKAIIATVHNTLAEVLTVKELQKDKFHVHITGPQSCALLMQSVNPKTGETGEIEVATIHRKDSKVHIRMTPLNLGAPYDLCEEGALEGIRGSIKFICAALLESTEKAYKNWKLHEKENPKSAG